MVVIETNYEDGVLIVEFKGIYQDKKEDKSYLEAWLDICSQMNNLGAKGLLVLNRVDYVLEMENAVELIRLLNSVPTLKASANVRYVLPDPKDIQVYTWLNSMAKNEGLEMRMFYSQDEAMVWLKEEIQEDIQIE